MFKIPALVNFVVFVLNAIYKIVGNYGIAIIIVTVLMRIIVFPLTLKQEKSMKKMREISGYALIDNLLKRFYYVTTFKIRCLKVRIGLLK